MHGRSAALLLPFIVLALIQKPTLCGGNEFLRTAGVVVEVALARAGQCYPRRMMEVVVPHAIQIKPALIQRKELLAALALIFGHHEDFPRAGRPTCMANEIGDDMHRTAVIDRLDCVQSQAVQMKLVDPIACVGDNQVARSLAILAIKIPRLTPLRMPIAEITGAEAFQVIAVGPQVVVNDVEDHRDAVLVSGIDQPLEALVVSIDMVWRK